MATEETSPLDEVEEAWFGLQKDPLVSFREEVLEILERSGLCVDEERVKEFLGSLDVYALSTLRTTYLRTLDPDYGASWSGGVLRVIDQLHPKSVLTPLALVRHHYRVAERPLAIMRVVAGNTRCILYDADNVVLATIGCATVNTNQYPPDTMRLKRTAEILEELTGETIDWHQLIKRKRAEARCLADSHWLLEME